MSYIVDITHTHTLLRMSLLLSATRHTGITHSYDATNTNANINYAEIFQNFETALNNIIDKSFLEQTNIAAYLRSYSTNNEKAPRLFLECNETKLYLDVALDGNQSSVQQALHDGSRVYPQFEHVQKDKVPELTYAARIAMSVLFSASSVNCNNYGAQSYCDSVNIVQSEPSTYKERFSTLCSVNLETITTLYNEEEKHYLWKYGYAKLGHPSESETTFVHICQESA